MLVALAFDATRELRHSVESRWYGHTETSTMLGLAITSRMIVHFFYLSLKQLSKKERIMMKFHHVLCITVYACGLYNKQCHFWGALAATCEVTNLFLNNFELHVSAYGHERDGKEEEPAEQKEYSMWYKANSACLLLAFAVFRLLLFPTLLFFWISDVYFFPTKTRLHPNMGVMELVVYPATTLMMFVLSVQWFVPLLNITLKTLKYRRKDITLLNDSVIKIRYQHQELM